MIRSATGWSSCLSTCSHTKFCDSQDKVSSGALGATPVLGTMVQQAGQRLAAGAHMQGRTATLAATASGHAYSNGILDAPKGHDYKQDITGLGAVPACHRSDCTVQPDCQWQPSRGATWHSVGLSSCALALRWCLQLQLLLLWTESSKQVPPGES